MGIFKKKEKVEICRCVDCQRIIRIRDDRYCGMCVRKREKKIAELEDTITILKAPNI